MRCQELKEEGDLCEGGERSREGGGEIPVKEEGDSREGGGFTVTRRTEGDRKLVARETSADKADVRNVLKG